MNNITPKILVILALFVAGLSFFGDDSYSKLKLIENELADQARKNQELRSYVTTLKDEVYQLQSNDRALERAARNELGMARPDELIFVFEEKGDDIAEILEPDRLAGEDR